MLKCALRAFPLGAADREGLSPGGSIPTSVDQYNPLSILAWGRIPIIVNLLILLSDMFVDRVLSAKFPLDGMLCCTCLFPAVLVYNQTGQRPVGYAHRAPHHVDQSPAPIARSLDKLEEPIPQPEAQEAALLRNLRTLA